MGQGLPSGHGGGAEGTLAAWLLRLRKGAYPGVTARSVSASLPRRQPTQPSALGLPTPVQNKVLRLLMIKMSPAHCTSSIGL